MRFLEHGQILGIHKRYLRYVLAVTGDDNRRAARNSGSSHLIGLLGLALEGHHW